jgi:regulator of RNase E activity RraA
MSTEGVSHESAGTTSARLTALSPATLGEAGGRCPMPSIRAAWPGATICGPAFTAWCPPGDNLALQAAVAGDEYPTYLRHLSGGLSWVLGHDR